MALEADPRISPNKKKCKSNGSYANINIESNLHHNDTKNEVRQKYWWSFNEKKIQNIIIDFTMLPMQSIVIGYILKPLRHINAPTYTAPYKKRDSGLMESKMQFWSTIRNLGILRYHVYAV